MSTYYANDRYAAVLTAGYSVGQTTLYVSAVPNHVPTIIVAAKGTENETIFAVTGKTTNSLTGVSRLRGANVDLDAQTPLTCLNNQEFINQFENVVFADVPTRRVQTLYHVAGKVIDWLYVAGLVAAVVMVARRKKPKRSSPQEQEKETP